MSLADLLADAVVGTVKALQELSDSADEREREAARAAVERVRVALDDVPVRAGPGGTWTTDTERRVAEAEAAIGERETLPPAEGLTTDAARIAEALARAGVTEYERWATHIVARSSLPPLEPDPNPYYPDEDGG